MSEAEKLRQWLDSLDKHLPDLSFEQVKGLLSSRLPRVPIPITDFDNSAMFFGQRESGGANLVYRARPNRTGGGWKNENFHSVKELSYVPSDSLDLLKSPGRVNKAHESIFYGAFDASTAAIETLYANENLIKNKSVFVTISVWVFNQPMVLADIPLSKKQHDALYEEFSENSRFKSKFDDSYFDSQLQKAQRIGYSELDKCVLDYFSDKFCELDRANNHYKASNYYASRAFNQYPEHKMPDGGVEGILYSSVAGSYQDRNIALLPSVVDEKLKFLEAQLVWVTIINDKFQLNPIDRANADAEGNLHWAHGR